MQQAQLTSEAGRVKCRMTLCSRNALLSTNKYCFLKGLYRLNGLEQYHTKRLMTVLKPEDLNLSLEQSKKSLR